jgi:hypothetical protein
MLGKNKKKVLTPLLPIRDAVEFPTNSPCRNVFFSTRNVERDQEDVELVLWKNLLTSKDTSRRKRSQTEYCR